MVKKRIDNELYVYYNGSLVYKRWIDKGYGIVIDKPGFYSFTSFGYLKDRDSEKNSYCK